MEHPRRHPTPWRVGHKAQHAIYDADDGWVGMTATAELAERVVEAVNYKAGRPYELADFKPSDGHLLDCDSWSECGCARDLYEVARGLASDDAAEG